MKRREFIKQFWEEFDADTMKKFKTFKLNYGMYVENAILRTLSTKKAKKVHKR